MTKTIKMVNANYNSSFEKSCRIEYTKYDNNLSKYKSHSATNDFIFSGGDILKYTAYSNIGERSIFDSPEYDQTIIFQFALGIPCPETPIVNYEGQAYNTVLIGNQCWLKENLNVGTLIGGNIEMSDNGAIEKYCYENNPINCDTYGGLYQWDEMMEYSNIQGTQGICPPGWHIPTDDELKILEGTVDSQFPVGDPAWNHLFDRGHDAGLNLKSTSGWYSGGCGFDLYCFTFLPSGSRHYNGFFVYLVSHGGIWTSSEYNTENAWRRSLNYEDDGVIRYFADKNFGHSIRCLKD